MISDGQVQPVRQQGILRTTKHDTHVGGVLTRRVEIRVIPDGDGQEHRNVGQGNDNGAWAANLPRITYAFEMKPAHGYSIRAEMEDTSGPVGRVMIVARERAPGGASVRWPIARSTADIDECRRWATAQGL